MSHPGLTILIPAAGASKRLGRAKQLVKLRGKTLLQKAVNSAFSIGPGEVIVVTGYQSDSMRQAVRQPNVHWVHHPRWPEGMGSSIAAGAAMVSRKSTGMMILLCDQWRIEAKDLSSLAETWRSDPERIVYAQVDGQNMPPVIFPASCFKQLQGLKGSHGARDLLAAHPDLLSPVQLENAAFDLDTQTQLNQLNSH
jgi:molybdenum cofactor cytidylyltransferase